MTRRPKRLSIVRVRMRDAEIAALDATALALGISRSQAARLGVASLCRRLTDALQDSVVVMDAKAVRRLVVPEFAEEDAQR